MFLHGLVELLKIKSCDRAKFQEAFTVIILHIFPEEYFLLEDDSIKTFINAGETKSYLSTTFKGTARNSLVNEFT